jgi:hypothetical protein
LDQIVGAEIASASGERGFLPISEKLRILIVWLSAQ